MLANFTVLTQIQESSSAGLWRDRPPYFPMLVRFRREHTIAFSRLSIGLSTLPSEMELYDRLVRSTTTSEVAVHAWTFAVLSMTADYTVNHTNNS